MHEQVYRDGFFRLVPLTLLIIFFVFVEIILFHLNNTLIIILRKKTQSIVKIVLQYERNKVISGLITLMHATSLLEF